MTPTRRKPSQERGKVKVDLILGSAKALIGERGNDAVSMREIAKHCGIAPSSIYQYFPDKNALLAAIMQGYFDKFEEINRQVYSSVSDIKSFSVAMDEALDEFYNLFLDDPLLTTIWSSVQASTTLRDMDIKNSRVNAEWGTDLLCKLYPSINRKEVYNINFLLHNTLGSTIRLALSVNRNEGDDLMNALKGVMIQSITRLVSQIEKTA